MQKNGLLVKIEARTRTQSKQGICSAGMRVDASLFQP